MAAAFRGASWFETAQERLLTMRKERCEAPEAEPSIIQPPAQFRERNHDVLAKCGASPSSFWTLNELRRPQTFSIFALQPFQSQLTLWHATQKAPPAANREAWRFKSPDREA